MSLNSRLSSLISSDSSSHAHSQAQTRSSEQDGFADTLFKPGSIRQNTVSRAMEANIEEDLEARRPPYWHVSAYADLSPTTTDLSLEHAGWRHRRNQWGYCYALARYCKNEAARRSPFSTKIYKLVEFICHNFSTRGAAARSLRRVRRCYAGIVPWYSSFLRFL